MYVTIGGRDPSVLTGAGKAFVEKYKEKYKTDPEAYAVYGYEAAKVVAGGDQEGEQEGPGRDSRGDPGDQGL